MWVTRLSRPNDDPEIRNVSTKVQVFAVCSGLVLLFFSDVHQPVSRGPLLFGHAGWSAGIHAGTRGRRVDDARQGLRWPEERSHSCE